MKIKRAMKIKRWLGIVLALFIASLMLTGVMQAQGTVTLIPTQITVAGSRGDVETRTLLLQSTEPLTNIQVVTLDLLNTDGTTVLPASAIQVSLPANTVAANEMMTLSLTVDMANAASGEFQGNLFINYHGGQLPVPLNVKVKDAWYLPLLTLVFGIGLAVGISHYRTMVKPRDEVLVRVGQLQAQMKKDAELAEPFRAVIDTAVVDVETALQTQKWEDAQAAMDTAEGYWNKWRRHRRDWLTQIAYYDELLAAFNQADPTSSSAYIQVIRRGVMDTGRTIADAETPEPLRQQLAQAGQQLNRYHALKAQIDVVGQTAGDLDPVQEAQWKNQATSWQNQLNELDPADGNAYAALKNQVSDGVAQIKAAVQAATDEMQRGDNAKGVFADSLSRLNFLTAPTLVDTGDEGQIVTANRNLRIFTLVSYAVAIGLLAGAGFAQLYIARPDFGANAWADYFALLAWGFGVEASRGAVVDMIRGWGIQ